MTASTLAPAPAGPLTSRPCFFCGRMMDLDRAVGQLRCKPCDVTESAEPGGVPVRSEVAATGTWAGTAYVDHAEVHQPTP
jgi:hypothetical protein